MKEHEQSNQISCRSESHLIHKTMNFSIGIEQKQKTLTDVSEKKISETSDGRHIYFQNSYMFVKFT